jgi:hypothetical protein
MLAPAGCKDRSPPPEPADGSEPVDGEEGGKEPAERDARLSRSFRGHEVWFVGGFMSELYDALSVQLENEINAALERSARSLNLHLDLPGDRNLDLAIGDAIADALPRIDLPIEQGRFVSFYTQMRDFDAKGIPYRNIALASPRFNSTEGVEHNAEAIAALLRNADAKVILVTHSKGSLDTLHALLEAPELWGRTVVGWVALQAPFHGSPLADPAPEVIHGVLLRALGGNAQSAEDLKTGARVRYMERHRARIRRLTAAIPVISAYTTCEASGTVSGFASTFASGIFSAQLVSEITGIVSARYAQSPRDLSRVIAESTTESIALIRKRITEAWSAAVGTIGVMTLTNVYLRDIWKLPNDGLVPKDSTALPGAVHRELTTGDHASPVTDVDPFKNFWTVEQRNEVTLSLIEEVRRSSRKAHETRKARETRR